MAKIVIKRIYDEPSEDDGVRILVDRLWPRGISKQRAKLARWLRDIAPSNELRKWYGHDPAKWAEFNKRYAAELKGKGDLLDVIREAASSGKVTLLFSSTERKLNNAAALRDHLLRR